jgi:hypothetical protein
MRNIPIHTSKIRPLFRSALTIARLRGCSIRDALNIILSFESAQITIASPHKVIGQPGTGPLTIKDK